MNKPGFLEDHQFWKVISKLDLLSEGMSLIDFCEASGAAPELVERGVIFLAQLSYPIEIVEHKNKKWIEKKGSAPQIKIQFSLLEWISLQAFFPIMAEHGETPFYPILSEKLAQLESVLQKHDLFATAESLPLMSKFVDSSIVSLFNEYLPLIEESILKQTVLDIVVNEKENISFFPHRVVHLEGKLRIVGEDINDHALVTFDLDLVKNINPIAKEYRPNYTVIEVNEFISGFREVSGNEVRLILKIQRDDEHLDLSPSYHFLGDPYITTNSTGETIWAASIEPCEDLVVWLAELGDRIEILDPLDFKESVENYRLTSNKKAA